MRWPISLASTALGLYVLRLSYVACGKWQEYLALGDPSGAEAYEVEFWPEAVVAVLPIAPGGFFAARAVKAKHRH